MGFAPEFKTYQSLAEKLKKKLPRVSLVKIREAYDFADIAHHGQFRMSGEPYVCHPLEVAKILVDLNADTETLIAAILHDVPEDTRFTLENVEEKFGKTVARMVGAVTKLAKVHYRHSMDEREVDTLRKLFFETAKDVRVVMIKLADRLHNMSTIQYLRPDKQERIAKETMEIFAPLANLYGVFQIRRGLEDYCFAVLQPEEFKRIAEFVAEHEKKRARFIRDTIAILRKALAKARISARFEGRPKHIYSIYQKMVARHKELTDIYDYFAVRIIVKNKEDCYRVLGVTHELFHPKPGRFKDYIAFPKPNGYQSLHTTVIGLQGKMAEVQIRSEEMNETAEMGAAAHNVYKGGGKTILSENISRLRAYAHPGAFIKSLQEDILQKRIYVFSAGGEIVNLPVGASCLDFIYATDYVFGKFLPKPLVNDKIYSLFGELRSGDHVQILEGHKEQFGPDRSWLEHTKTAKAREKIQAFFKKQSRGTRLGLGIQLLQKQLDHENQVLVENLSEKKMEDAVKRFRSKNFDEVLILVGDGSLEANEVYKVLFPDLQLGYFVRLKKKFRTLEKDWNFGEQDNKYKIRIIIEAYDRRGILKEIVQPFYELKIPILHIEGSGHDVRSDYPFSPDGKPLNMDHVSHFKVDVLVENHEELIALFDRLEKLTGILHINRTFRQSAISFFILSMVIAVYFLWHPIVLKFLLSMNLEHEHIWLHVVICLGLTALFLLLIWLRTMGNKTFPHFEETKMCWPLSFGLSFLAVGMVFMDNTLYNLHLNLAFPLVFSLFILVFLISSFFQHKKRRRIHLNRLEAAHVRKRNV
ncbi:MAG: RelA/SpoT family protein [Candidatus Gracilibacteria bacterium]|jgi:GTP pyrophosphokinase